MFKIAHAQKPKIRVPLGTIRKAQASIKGGNPEFPIPADIPFLQNHGFRVTLIVLDSAGIGVMPKHPAVDDGCNTIPNVAAYYEAKHPGEFRLPNFQALGLGNIVNIEGVPPLENPAGAFGVLTLDPVVMTDTPTGHWGLMGLNTGEYPTYLSGIPAGLMDRVEAGISKSLEIPVQLLKDGRNISGTTILELVGEQGLPIVYTSSDSVFQIAYPVGRVIGEGKNIPEGPDTMIVEEKIKEGNEEKLFRFAVSIREKERMYEICRACRAFLNESPDWGDKFLRVIARPFATRAELGPKGEKFIRITSLRKDYTLAVPGKTILDYALAAEYPTIGVGKFYDIFSGKGLKKSWPDPAEHRHLKGDMEGIDCILKALGEEDSGIIGVNLVDLDEQFGHRNDPEGYAKNLMAIDSRLPEISAAMDDWDIVIITADHGNDPTRGLTKLWIEEKGLDPQIFKAKGTNHTREFVPLLVFGNPIQKGIYLGIREMADVGATVAHYLGFRKSPHGMSFLNQILDWSVFEFV